MLDDFLPELEVVDVNRCDEAYQFICHGKKSCTLCPSCAKCSYRVHSRYIRTLRDERVFGMDGNYGLRRDVSSATIAPVPRVSSRNGLPPYVDPHTCRTIHLEHGLSRLLSSIGLERILNNISDSTATSNAETLGTASMTAPGENDKSMGRSSATLRSDSQSPCFPLGISTLSLPGSVHILPFRSWHGTDPSSSERPRGHPFGR